MGAELLPQPQSLGNPRALITQLISSSIFDLSLYQRQEHLYFLKVSDNSSRKVITTNNFPINYITLCIYLSFKDNFRVI